MVSEELEQVRREIGQLLSGLRRDLAEGSVTLYREHLAEDASILAIDNPRTFKGKSACLEYIRCVSQETRFQSLEGEIEELKLIGDVAIVIEGVTARYEVRGETYTDTARTTAVLCRNGGRWLVTHLHLESLAANRIIAQPT